MKFVELGKTGIKVPVLGMGTWGDGFRLGHSFDRAVRVLRKGLDLGIGLIDTAEIYGFQKGVKLDMVTAEKYGLGYSEIIVGEAIKGCREEVFVATKVMDYNLGYDNLITACEKSLKRLHTKVIDLYQIHYPNPKISIKESMRAMEYLLDEGKILSIGVSNFSLQQLKEAQNALSKYEISSIQNKYNWSDRQVEKDILPYCQKNKITFIAFSPLAQGFLKPVKALRWLINKPGVIAIPKTINPQHLVENLEAIN